MSLPNTRMEYSVEYYLAMERESVERHEYLDGEIYEMAGESPAHGAICMNLSRIISTQLLGTRCQAFAKDIKVRSGPKPEWRNRAKGLYSYPDLLVVCGELEFHDERRDVLLNPLVIIEVLSESTEAFDRGEKWMRYQTWLPELSDYVLVSQTRPYIERYNRQPNGQWIYTRAITLEESLRVDSINCVLPLADVYDRVVFPPEPSEESEEEADDAQAH